MGDCRFCRQSPEKESEMKGERRMSETILSMKGIVKVFGGVHALNDVQFELEKGEIHALIGENGAGKSTLMKVLIGLCEADAGEVILKGKQVHFHSPVEALRSGISMIHQEISLVPEMDVAENIWLGRESLFKTAGLINRKKRYEKTKELLEELEIQIEPSKKIRDLSVANMQLVELARAVSYQSDIIIMDEPTSALTNKEIEILYRIARKLAAEGTAIIFISHKLEEIYDICQRVTVLRDGTYVATELTENLRMETLINMIVGRKNTKAFEKNSTAADQVILEVRNLSKKGVFSNVSFKVHAGEVLGFSGLMGAGRTEIMEAVFGITRPDSGEILYLGQKIENKNPAAAVANGIGMVTEDRLRTGAIPTLSVMQNLTIAAMKNLDNKIGMYSHKKEHDFFERNAKEFEVKYDSENDLVGSLSGGNQQKVIFARWLSTKPKVLILDEPTRGIDVGSKQEIYRLVSKLASEGMAILLVSSEMPELLSLSDYIHVVREGKIVYSCSREEATQEKLISYAFGIQQNGGNGS